MTSLIKKAISSYVAEIKSSSQISQKDLDQAFKIVEDLRNKRNDLVDKINKKERSFDLSKIIKSDNYQSLYDKHQKEVHELTSEYDSVDKKSDLEYEKYKELVDTFFSQKSGG